MVAVVEHPLFIGICASTNSGDFDSVDKHVLSFRDGTGSTWEEPTRIIPTYEYLSHSTEIGCLEKAADTSVEGTSKARCVSVFCFAASCPLDPKLGEHRNSKGGDKHELEELVDSSGRRGVLCHHDLKHIDVPCSESKVARKACEEHGSKNSNRTTLPRCIADEVEKAMVTTREEGPECGLDPKSSSTVETLVNTSSVDCPNKPADGHLTGLNDPITSTSGRDRNNDIAVLSPDECNSVTKRVTCYSTKAVYRDGKIALTRG